MNLIYNEIFSRSLPKKLKDFANKRQIKHPRNMGDSEEKIKTQELYLDINTLSNNFVQNATVREISLESTQIHAVDPNNKSDLNI